MKAYTSEDLERICDAHWNGSGEGVHFDDIFQHNATNHTLSGTIEISGNTCRFIINNGDWNGTEVVAWGSDEDTGIYAHPSPPEPLTFVPSDESLHVKRPQMFKVYSIWRREPWFTEMERAYNYDRHFQPGERVERHYRDKAAQRGMKVGLLSNLAPEALAILKEAK